MSEQSLQKIAAGPFLVLLCAAHSLLGILAAQIYNYWTTYSHDRAFLKRYVMVVGVLAACHSTFTMMMIYDYYVTSFGNAETGLLCITWSARACNFVQILFAAMTQALCASRIWYLSGKKASVTTISVVLVVCRVGLGFASFYFFVTNSHWVNFTNQGASRFTANFSLATSALADTATSLVLIYYLAIGRCTASKVTRILNRLIIHILSTATLTVTISLAVLFLFNFDGDSLLFAGLYIILGPIYANTMLAMLNSRRAILDMLSSNECSSLNIVIPSGPAAGTIARLSCQHDAGGSERGRNDELHEMAEPTLSVLTLANVDAPYPNAPSNTTKA